MVTARLVAARMSEAELEEAVRSMCRDLGLTRWHVRDSRGSDVAGMPDDILLGPRGVLWRELKSETGALTPDQRRAGSRLERAGQDWAVYRPRDLLSGVIARQLGAIAGLGNHTEETR